MADAVNYFSLSIWKQKAKQLKSEVYALYFVYRDSRVPWYAKLFIFLIVAYTLSPIDLIPDFIPVLGYLDELILIPLGVALVIRLIPVDVMSEGRIKAESLQQKPKNMVGAVIVVFIWMLIFFALIKMFSDRTGNFIWLI